MIELKDQNKYDRSCGRLPIKLIYNGKEMTLKEYARLNDISCFNRLFFEGV